MQSGRFPVCANCKGRFKDAFLYLKGYKWKNGKEYWPICQKCAPDVLRRHREKENGR